jgi:hypothetical protein
MRLVDGLKTAAPCVAAEVGFLASEVIGSDFPEMKVRSAIVGLGMKLGIRTSPGEQRN